ncbi:MAG: DEAD/DEAH box helicase [Deltaproteobacteria bacterium]|nr:DEAD/DEAH box helicase [Deltaproteobacteria bacterium]
MSDPTPETAPRASSFAGASRVVTNAAAAFGWEAPTTVQAAALPALAEGRDVVVVAGPARGRTGAWLLPLVDAVEPGAGLSALVLVPDAARARALANALAAAREGLVALSIDAESELAKAVARLERGVDVVVGTAARVMELHSRGALDIAVAGWIVVDRADDALDGAGLSDVEWVLGRGRSPRRTVLVTAALATPHRRLIKKYMADPVEVSQDALPDAPAALAVALTRGRALREAVTAWVGERSGAPTVVWTRSRTRAEALSTWLRGAGFRAEALHTGLAVRARQSVAARFRRGELEVVVVTDVAGRDADLGSPGRSISVGLPAEPGDLLARSPLADAPATAEMILQEHEQVGLDALSEAWGIAPGSLHLPAVARPVAPGAAVAARTGEAQSKPTAPSRRAPGESTVRLYIGGGGLLGANARDIVRELMRRGGVDERAIGFVEVLGRSSFVDLTTQAARQVLDRVRFIVLGGEEVPVSVARPRREKTDGPGGPPGNRGPGRERSDRPLREGGGGPPRRGFSDRPPREGGGGRPERGFRTGHPGRRRQRAPRAAASPAVPGAMPGRAHAARGRAAGPRRVDSPTVPGGPARWRPRPWLRRPSGARQGPRARRRRRRRQGRRRALSSPGAVRGVRGCWLRRPRPSRPRSADRASASRGARRPRRGRR